MTCMTDEGGTVRDRALRAAVSLGPSDIASRRGERPRFEHLNRAANVRPRACEVSLDGRDPQGWVARRTFVFVRHVAVSTASDCQVLAIALLLGLWAPGAVAQVSPTAPGSCNRILDDRERLACYDRLNGFDARLPEPAVQLPGPDTAAAQNTPVSASLIDEAWAFGPDTDRYMLGYHRPNYLLAARYTDDVNQAPFSPIFGAAGSDEELDSVEARFQLSFKGRAWSTEDRRWGVWLAYTQTSQWQIYNEGISRPFRETNYEPEALVSFRPDLPLGSYNLRLINFGYNHQSNGRTQVLSRSWDRVFVEFGVERDQFALLTKFWHRLPESAEEDDNPDIHRYMGYGEMTGLYKWRDHSFSLMLRGNWNTSKGAARFSWMTPRLLGPIRGYLQAFSGYGDSMIDYNWKQNVIGVGIAVNDTL